MGEVEVKMITDRTLLAYEQFCENYYDDFSIPSRAQYVSGIISNRKSRKDANVPRINISDDRDRRLNYAVDIGSVSEKHAKAGFPVNNVRYTRYNVSPRVAKKIRMKREPGYAQKVIDAKEARRQYHSPEAIAERKAARADKKRIENAAKKIGNWDKEYDEYV